MDKIPQLMKELRGAMQLLKTKKLMRLDRSDRLFVEGRLREVINDVYRLEAIGSSQCTCVLELYEFMGGQVRTAAN